MTGVPRLRRRTSFASLVLSCDHPRRRWRSVSRSNAVPPVEELLLYLLFSAWTFAGAKRAADEG
jgi:hypothetical protein